MSAPSISARSLVLQGLVLATTLTVSETISRTITVAVEEEERRNWKGLIPRYLYSGALVVGTVVAANTVLKDPVKK